MRSFLLTLALLVFLPLGASANPEVVATVAPVDSLVARVMEGVGAPRLLVPPAAEPHDFALKPSDAAALARADLVFRVGPALEPWLDRPLAALAGRARVVQLDRVPGVTRLPLRHGVAFDKGSRAAQPTRPLAETGLDPHLWLDPENARVWLGAIAKALGQVDPAHAALYAANAQAGRAEIGALEAGISERIAPLRGRPFVMFHDAFQYFERRFGIVAVGAVMLSDASAPGPARIAAVRALIARSGARCLFRPPQFDPALARTVAQGTGARIALLDPLGTGLKLGPGLYAALLRAIAGGLGDCLG